MSFWPGQKNQKRTLVFSLINGFVIYTYQQIRNEPFYFRVCLFVCFIFWWIVQTGFMKSAEWLPLYVSVNLWGYWIESACSLFWDLRIFLISVLVQCFCLTVPQRCQPFGNNPIIQLLKLLAVAWFKNQFYEPCFSFFLALKSLWCKVGTRLQNATLKRESLSEYLNAI